MNSGKCHVSCRQHQSIFLSFCCRFLVCTKCLSHQKILVVLAAIIFIILYKFGRLSNKGVNRRETQLTFDENIIIVVIRVLSRRLKSFILDFDFLNSIVAIIIL